MTADNTNENVPVYTAYYCEENIWHLCQTPSLRTANPRVVFISNPAQQCALFFQRAAPTRTSPVIWDYHVILLYRANRTWTIWDLDCTLPQPLDATTYIDNVVPAKHHIYQRYPPPQFRLVDAQDYVARFASDRRHMRSGNGQWSATPPRWPPIGQVGHHTLPMFVEMNHGGPGTVMSLTEFRALASGQN